jgi:hypothetical protein
VTNVKHSLEMSIELIQNSPCRARVPRRRHGSIADLIAIDRVARNYRERGWG